MKKTLLFAAVAFSALQMAAAAAPAQYRIDIDQDSTADEAWREVDRTVKVLAPTSPYSIDKSTGILTVTDADEREIAAIRRYVPGNQ